MSNEEVFICMDCDTLEELTHQEAMEVPQKLCPNCRKRKWAKPIFREETDDGIEFTEFTHSA